MATFLEMWNGSVCVVVIVATRPIDDVAGATRAMASRASNRPGNVAEPGSGGSNPSSRARKSNPATSAVWARATSRSAVNRPRTAPGARHAAGWAPAPSMATPRYGPFAIPTVNQCRPS